MSADDLLLPLVAVDETATGTCQTNTLTPAASSTITHAVSSKSGGNSYTYDCNPTPLRFGDFAATPSPAATRL